MCCSVSANIVVLCALISRCTGGTNNIINDGCVPAITALQPLAGPDWLHSTHFDLSQQELNNTGHVRPLPIVLQIHHSTSRHSSPFWYVMMPLSCLYGKANSRSAWHDWKQEKTARLATNYQHLSSSPINMLYLNYLILTKPVFTVGVLGYFSGGGTDFLKSTI